MPMTLLMYTLLLKNMLQNLDIHGAWWIRSETIDDSVRRILQTFRSLGRLRSDWEFWFKPSKLAGPIDLTADPEKVRSELLSSRALGEGWTDISLGYSLISAAGKNGTKWSDFSHIQLTCCKTSWAAGYNNITLELPSNAPELGFHDVSILSETICILAEIWDPDWLVAGGLGQSILPPPWPAGPRLGLVNYLSARIAIVNAPLPQTWTWYQGGRQKHILVYTGDITSPLAQDEVRSFKEITNRLKWLDGPWNTRARSVVDAN
jgi:hypothetical protein